MRAGSATSRRRPNDFGSWDSARERLVRFSKESRFVAKQLRDSNLTAEEAISDPASWRRVREVSKQDFIEDQNEEPPYGTRLCVPVSEIGLIVESSGSSGKGRETHYLSRGDFDVLRRVQGRFLAGMGMGPEDTVALTLPVGMAGGGVKIMEALALLGAKIVRLANLSARQKLEAMSYYRTSLLVGTPFYVDRLRLVAQESGVNVRDIGVRRILVATQSVSVDWISSTQEFWGAALYEWYGASSGLIALCCRDGMMNPHGERGTLHWDPDFAFHEVIDTASGSWVEGEGARGELVGTTLQAEAEPLFRIASGDEVQFRPPGSCRCGSAQPGIESGTIRRRDQMIKVKGVNLWPSHVEAVLFETAAVRDYRARIFQDEDRREVIHVQVLARAPEKGLADRLDEFLREATGLSFDIEIVDDPAQWGQHTVGEAEKAQRWVDERRL